MNKQHGSLIWGLHVQEVPAHLAAKHATWAPLGVVEGPTEPKSMQWMLEEMEYFFYKHDPGAITKQP
jgi:hypothetical protein